MSVGEGGWPGVCVCIDAGVQGRKQELACMRMVPWVRGVKSWVHVCVHGN